ncbi:MFS transporter [Tengunoibacter tsumagoiensis]|uniref:Tetracycline resistance MFS efflux pump n=1 Tax=Tengunoibacter tsumagoiensis TaxID=2014871 RepID=A0A402A9S8_9CHLR|nr:MFS transporter [Tengunoibacter tsumagoiensis]GCE15766.1 tetracycline resistance MFS efflux pump [Tengunoibacter tsumagoiensis]
MQTDVQQEGVYEETPTKKSALGTQALIFMMITALLSAIGFGIISPVVPFLVRPYVAQANVAVTMGWVTSIYALCQLFAAPVLGALSDIWGRRWLLLLCLLGSAIGYFLMGIGGALWVLILGRVIDGITGGNFSILAAYIADVTRPEDRGKYFGQLGAMVGVGFILGPVMGGFLARFGISAPLYAAAGITLLNIVLGLFALPESLSKEQRAQSQFDRSVFNPLQHFVKIFTMKQIFWLLIVMFCYTLPFSAILGGLNGILAIDTLGWHAEQIGYMMLGVGCVDILMQGVLSGMLLKRFSEAALTISGLICVAASYVSLTLLAIYPFPLFMFAMIALWGIGSGLIEPASRGLLSRMTPPEDQGVVNGSSQSIQSLCLIVGPLLAGWAYGYLGRSVPFLVGAAIFLLGIVAMCLAMPMVRRAVKASEAAPIGIE